MLRTILAFTVLFGCAASTQSAEPLEGIPQAIQAARSALADSVVDSTSCRQIASDLLRLTDKFADSPLRGEAWLAASELLNATGDEAASYAMALRIVEEDPRSDVAPAAFDWIWARTAMNEDSSAQRARFAERFAQSLESPASKPYFELAFHAYRTAGLWQNALKTGEAYRKVATPSFADAPLLIDLAEVALTLGETAQALSILQDLIARYPELALTIKARVKLAEILQSTGDKPAARDQNTRAWSAYQKQLRTGEMLPPDVSRAAAHALWELKKEDRRELLRLAAIGEPADKELIRAQAEELLSAYEDIMRIDPELAPQALNASGDVRAAVADALLAIGFRKSLGSISPKAAPYREAIDEYGKAIALHTLAYERTQIHSHDGEAEQAASYAATHAFELRAGQGDAILAWAMELFRRAPDTRPGEGGSVERIEYLTDVVTPLLNDGLRYKNEALTLANRMPLEKEPELLRRSMDAPLRPVADELYALCRDQFRATEASATQLASTFSYGLESSSTCSLAETMESSFALSAELAATLQEALASLYSPLQQSAIPAHSQSYWDSLTAAATWEYASLCRDLQSDITTCLASLNGKRDDSLQPLVKKLGKLQSRGASEEFASLVRWQETVPGRELENPIASRLASRLSELDPDRFGGIDDASSASRRKP